MSKSYVQPGDAMTFTAPVGGVVSGTPYLIGTLVVIAMVTAAEGQPFSCTPIGVHEVPKVNAQAWTEGALLYWDNTARNFTTAGGGSSVTRAGVAAIAAPNPSATGLIRLNGVAAPTGN